MPDAAIRIEGLRKTYKEVAALDGLDLAVQPGSIFGFLGPNGAGKTTTLRILTGLARATAGRAWIAGVEIGQGDARRLIGYLPEEPAFYNWMSPREYLRDLIGPVFGLGPGDARARAEELLALAGLEAAAKRRIGGFSRGMRQRLGLAQALMNRPQVLLLDEPVSALDPAGRHEVLEFIERLRGQATVFMSTHILADVERVCDAVGIIQRGRLVTQAGRDELLARFAAPVCVIVFEAPAEAVNAWAQSLAGQPLVASAAVEGSSARLTVADLARGRREMPGLVAAAGLPVQRYEWQQPSLEDVFLKTVEER